ncbi:MAG: arginine decarboxylase, pyruvoyl-dependent [Omnitrophica bacterium RIFCSPLOWO2_12_FULL_44_17]|uniref:Pyruvoyl-dependent arginine decarboxylase AaxB n=1 Tax=Candidatus Danuiimicrobium aquiferis TaxID=1801832 RepID=A0A1G1KX70_9BACT|nr:MAG: arginine decarboxylase, pyruvoyl-dependent [Omnitrophica bacterium RIFCSPHIGHO2_02_FULL_45_28]OGW89316.1 MAG: arginine decarboxylase, pyruvoyl-dependent [Omnitrophica bacterium RIFCSPHIGHO2_12_FULL_44_12]OGW97481.1 MAG: arginine decarboxylase, pyruvoyl-dependent [Omnitrophica bacterium RIFCSPLOWO2_12_FULL_44_17]OGX04938.1 MAG: arginine decarboxylase, pyruvoyl-dependent [Omnitrophica bacterium RIFCSPLOWO2_02_FULL_44_11]
MILPKKCFLTKGVGVHREKLTSLELALRNAEIAGYNLVKVSSIFPPNCKIVPKEVGLKYLSPGQVVFCVMSENSTSEPNRLVSGSVGMAIPKNTNQIGYLSEHHAFGWNEKKTADYAEDLAAEMLATILGLKFDPDLSYDKKREVWKISGEIVKTTAVTQSAEGDKDGRWTSVVSACVFIV